MATSAEVRPEPGGTGPDPDLVQNSSSGSASATFSTAAPSQSSLQPKRRSSKLNFLDTSVKGASRSGKRTVATTNALMLLDRGNRGRGTSKSAFALQRYAKVVFGCLRREEEPRSTAIKICQDPRFDQVIIACIVVNVSAQCKRRVWVETRFKERRCHEMK